LENKLRPLFSMNYQNNTSNEFYQILPKNQ
jgi:hypothetical protein